MSRKIRKTPRDEARGQVRKTVGSSLNFAAAEAYKLLRTNLLYTFADSQEGCKVVGITSALRSEGKSTTAINLAHSLSETGKKVLLIEMDMRLPCVAKRLALHFQPGLSNILIDAAEGAEAVQTSSYTGNLHVIVSGDMPPNPAELIGSKRMKRLMDELRERYDYIVCDLPPVNAVSDGLVAASLVDGYIFVVRRDFCERAALDEAMHRMEILNINLLGFALTRADNTKKSYKRYGRYGYGYGYGHYGRPTENAASAPTSEPENATM